MVLAYYFGAHAERDAYFSAVAVPTYITSLFVGSLTVIFLPYFVDFKKKYDEQKLIQFVSSTMGFCLMILSLTAIGGFLASDFIIHLIAPGFDGSQFILARELFSILIFTIIFQSMSSFISVFHHTENRFLLPAVGPIMIPITALLFVVSFNVYGIKSLAWGTLLGSFLSLLIVLPFALKKIRVRNLFNFVNADTGKLLLLALPLFISGAFTRLTTVSERIMASRLPAGSISYLGYGNQIYLLLATVATGSIVTTFYPAISSAWADKNNLEFNRLLVKAIVLILLITLPIAALFIALGNPIIQILFQRGAFDSETTNAVANALALMMGAFIFGSLGNILVKVFYIANKTLLISIIGTIDVTIYIVVGYLLSLKYSYLGLAFALSLSTSFTIIASVYFLLKWKHIILDSLLLDSFKLLLASIVCGISACLVFNFLIVIEFNVFISTAISCLMGIIIYLSLILYVFRISDSNTVNKIIEGFWNKILTKY